MKQVHIRLIMNVSIPAVIAALPLAGCSSNSVSSPTVKPFDRVSDSASSKIVDKDSDAMRGPWPKFRADSRSTGRGIGNNKDAVGERKWKFRTGGPVRSSPCVGADETVYIGSFDGKVYAIDGVTGNKKWDFKTGGRVYSSPALGPMSTVYVGSTDGNLYALNGATGKKKWQMSTHGVDVSPATIVSDRIVIVSSAILAKHDNDLSQGEVYAVDAMTGSVLWKSTRFGVIASCAAVSQDNTVFVAALDGKLSAFRADNGKEKWQVALPVSSIWGRTGLTSPLIGDDGNVYVASISGEVYSVNGVTGKKQWTFRMENPTMSSLAATHDGFIIISSMSAALPNNGGVSKVYAIDEKTGKMRWNVNASSDLISSPAISGKGIIYIGANNNKLYALDSKTGKKKWAFTTTGNIVSSPSIGSSGTIYVGSDDGFVYAIR